MALAAGPEAQIGRMVIRNIGLMLSGMLERPILDADTVVAEAGRIVAVGREKDCDTAEARVVIDAQGCALTPGLIDSHVHPVFGDWTPRQGQLGWIDSTLNGGVTTMVSAGEVHLPGRPRDIVGLKALAITAQRAYHNFRPAGVKVLAGAPVIEHGMVEEDFAELARSGVTLLGEVGLGSVKAGYEAKEMVGWARKYGIQSTIHTGGPSVPGSGYIDADVVLEADADIIGHINGGHTALPLRQIRCLCEGCGRGIEIVHNGNELAGLVGVAVRQGAGAAEPGDLGDGRAGRVWRAAAGDFADGGAAVEPGGHAGGRGVLLCDGEYGADAQPGLRADRGGPGGGFRADGPGAALGWGGYAGFGAQGGFAGDRDGDRRRDRPVRAQPEHAAGGAGAGGGLRGMAAGCRHHTTSASRPGDARHGPMAGNRIRRRRG